MKALRVATILFLGGYALKITVDAAAYLYINLFPFLLVAGQMAAWKLVGHDLLPEFVAGLQVGSLAILGSWQFKRRIY